MSFLAPLFLLGGLAVALPVVYHLVRRSSREKQPFSSLMFLKPTPPRMTKRNRLEHILLLLLRCLAICLLAFAFARPFIQKPAASPSASNAGAQTVLLVDTSASMQREDLWSDALDEANEELKKASMSDQVAILAFDEQVRRLMNFEQWTALNQSERAALGQQLLAEIKPTWRATHIGNALTAAAELLEESEREEQQIGPRRIVLISDMQEGSRLDGLQGHEWPRGLEVEIRDLKVKRPTNAGLQWVQAADESLDPAQDAAGRIRVSNSSDATHEQFQIRWSTATNSASLDAYVPPGQNRVIPLPQLTNGVLAERIVLSGDNGEFDNTAYVVQSSPEEVNVLFVGETKEGDPSSLLFYLRRAFQDTRKQSVRLHTLRNAPPTNLSTNRLIILDGLLSEDLTSNVRQYINHGGTALLVMNNVAISSTLAHLTGQSGITVEESPTATYAMLGEMDFTHPLFAAFADPRFGDFTKIRFWKHRRLSLDQLAGARTVAGFDNDDPAIVEVPVGRGRLWVFTFSWHPPESQFALSSKFVPLLYSMLEQAGGRTDRFGTYRVGDVVDLTDLTTRSGAGLTIGKPNGDTLKLQAGETQFTQTDQPGMYEVMGPPPVRFAVNLDSAESRTAPLAADELERLGVPTKAADVTPAQLATQEVKLRNSELEAQQKLWRWLIVAALTVLLVETWLAGWTSRRLAGSTEATA